MKSPIYSILISAAVLTLIACGKEDSAAADQDNSDNKQALEVKSEITPVEVLELKYSEFQNQQTFYADARANRTAQLVSRAGGKVNSVKVENGQWVKKGQALCDIDAAIHQTNYELAVAQFELAETEYQRLQEYVAQQLGSQTQLNQAKVQFLQAKQAKLNTQETYKEARCIAPFSGIVGMKSIETHQTINPGSPTLQLLSSSYLKLQFGIPENLIQEYHSGNTVQVELADGSWKSAKINYLAASIDPQTRTYMAEVKIANSQKPRIPVGASVKVKAQGMAFKGQWVVPNASILNYAKSNAIMITDGQTATRKDVKILASNGTHSRIQAELQEGDLLVVANQHRLIDGSQVVVKSGDAQ